MSITDELRKWAEGDTLRAGMSLRTARGQVLAIADSIDKAHEEALSRLYMDMSDSEWVRLPKDADGEPIHIGDKLIDKDDKLPKPAIVKCILYNDEGCAVSDVDPHGIWYESSLLHHYNAPTVEDLLRQFLGECEHASMLGYTDMPQDIFDTYTAKLQLRGDE